MIPRKHKLPASEFFQKASGSFFSEALRVKTRRSDKGHNRFAVVIGAKAEKRAVRRHFWKRLVYDTAGQWPNKSRDVIIIVSPRIQKTTARQLRQQLADLARQFSSITI